MAPAFRFPHPHVDSSEVISCFRLMFGIASTPPLMPLSGSRLVVTRTPPYVRPSACPPPAARQPISQCEAAGRARCKPARARGRDRAYVARPGTAARRIPSRQADRLGAGWRSGRRAAVSLSRGDCRRRTSRLGRRLRDTHLRLDGRGAAGRACRRPHQCAPLRRSAAQVGGVCHGGARRGRAGGHGNGSTGRCGARRGRSLCRAHRTRLHGRPPYRFELQARFRAMATGPVRRPGRPGRRPGRSPCARTRLERARQGAFSGDAL